MTTFPRRNHNRILPPFSQIHLLSRFLFSWGEGIPAWMKLRRSCLSRSPAETLSSFGECRKLVDYDSRFITSHMLSCSSFFPPSSIINPPLQAFRYGTNAPMISELGNPIVRKWNKVDKKKLEFDQHLKKILFLFHNYGLKVNAHSRVGDPSLQQAMNYHLRDSFGKVSKYLANKVLNKQKDPRLAYAFFKWAQSQPRFRPDVYTYTVMIRIFGRSRSFKEMEDLIDEMDEAEDKNCKPNTATFNEMIKSYGIASELEKANSAFFRMKSCGIAPNIITFSILLDIHTKLGKFEEALNVIRAMKYAQVKPDNIFCASVISLYGKMGRIDKAEEVLNSMKAPDCTPNTQTYNIMMDLYVKVGQKDQALKLFQKMISSGKKPTIVSFSTVISACMDKNYSYLLHLMSEMQTRGVHPDAIFYTEVINQSLKRGMYSVAEEFFDKMKHSNVEPSDITYTVMILEYIKNANFEKVKDLMIEMKKKRLLPSFKLYIHLLQALIDSKDEKLIDNLWAIMGNVEHSIHGLFPVLLHTNVWKVEHLWKQVEIYLEILRNEDRILATTFIDGVVNLMVKFFLNDVAHQLWELQRQLGFVVRSTRTKRSWSLDLHDLTPQTALIAVKNELLILKSVNFDRITGIGRTRIVNSFNDRGVGNGNGSNNDEIRWGERKEEALDDLPENYCIITGWGKNSRVEGRSLVKNEVEQFLISLQSPFAVNTENAGQLIANDKSEMMIWLNRPEVYFKLKSFDLPIR